MARESLPRLGVSAITIYRWCHQGTVPCLKVGRSGRIRHSALDRLPKERRALRYARRAAKGVPAGTGQCAGVVQREKFSYKLDAAFLRVLQASGGMLVKFYREHTGADSGEELRTEFEVKGV